MIQEIAPQGFATTARRDVERMLSAVRCLLLDDSGQGLVEYALLITFTAIVCLAGLRYLGAKTNNTLANAANSLS